ncbi:hypothetical protein LTR64_004755 [Lithohypha guttulata]|uniref:uncharacterized protein n=1 Tax=Lithohypha guttulata TaxID=1690604 RepID=UPI002DDDDF68|nr:hypothetical protein LTR51_005948 [Lithohypha guttulata]
MSEIEAKLEMRKLKPEETPQSLAQEGYNSSAYRYLDWNSSLEDDPRVEWLQKLFDRLWENGALDLSTTKALDLGCGAGSSTLKLAQTCTHVVGVDISSAQLELAKTKLKDAGVPSDKYELLEADMMTPEFADGCFHAICAFYSIIHLGLNDQRTLLERIYAWLEPRGLLLFNTAAQASAAEGEVMEGWLGMNAFWASFGQKRVLEVVQEIGFETVDSDEIEVEGDSDFTWIIARKPASN